MKKQAWTAILLWMALFSFTLSAQEGGNTGLTVTPEGGTTETIRGSRIIESSGTYHFKGTYNGTLTAEVGSSEETAVISVEAGDVTIILDGVTISLSENQQCPLSARNATGKVTVQLKGTNTLTSGAQCPALWAPQTTGGELIIENLEEGVVGSLTAKGGENAAGIGGGNGDNGGKITISGGNVTATGGTNGAGIGGGYGGGDDDGNEGNGGKITISGGTVTANGGSSGAGIGGGYKGDGGEITISSSSTTKVTATGGPEYNSSGTSDGGAGIGAGDGNSDGTITITGGTVTAIDGSKVTGATENAYDIKGNTVIVGPGATMEGTLNCSYTNGFVLSNTEASATMQGTATLSANMTINAGQTLTISQDASLTIEENVTLENKGTITNNGTITNDNGTIKNAGTITGTVSEGGNLLTKLTEEMITITEGPYTYTGSEVKPTSVTVKSSDNTVYEEGGDKDYTLAYADNINAGTATVKVTPTNPTGGKLYGDPVSKEFTIEKAAPIATDFTFTQPTDLTYNGQAKEANVQANSDITGMGNITINYYKETQLLSSAPADAGTYTVKISVTEGTNFTAGSDITADNWKFEITKAMPTFAAWTVSDKVYDGDPISVDKPALTGIGNETISADEVTLTYYLSDGEGTTETTAENSGAASEGVAPVWAGNYQVKASYAGNDNFKPAETSATFSITPANATLSFAQQTLTITQGDAVPTNALTNPHTCPVTYSSSNEAVATVNADGVVTVVGVGTTTIKATAQGNYTGSASYTLTVNSSIPPYIPPTPDPDPVYYTVTIPTEVTGAIIHNGGTHEVEEYTYYTFRIELDPNGNREYPTVTKGYWWDTLTPDGQGNYRVYVTGNTQITIGEVPTNSYTYYQVTLPTDSVTEAENQYWSGDYIEVIGATPLRAAEAESIGYQVPFGATVTVRPIETEQRKFLMWEDGSTRKERTLTLRANQEIKALWKRISPTGIEAIADGSVIRGERGQLYIEVPEPCDVTLYTYGGVPVRVARLAAGANRLSNLNAGLYLVKIGGAQTVPVRVR